jgi:pimeloyl-[acyl-carrier protein] synthase
MISPILASAWPISTEDPYPDLAALLEQGPVHHLEELDVHLVVSHPLARQILGTPDHWSSDLRIGSGFAERFGMAADRSDLLVRSILFSDPPSHTRLRRSIGPFLAPRAIESMRPRIAAIVHAAFSAMEPGSDIDVLSEIAYPIPLAVICELLGAGPDTALAFRRDTPQLVGVLDPLADEDTVAAAAEAALSLMFELVPLVASRRAEGSGDVITALGPASDSAGLEVEEIILMLLILLAAGHETTSTLVANAVVLLHSDPALLEHLRSHLELVPAAVEELLRLVSPVQLIGRIASTHVDLAGHTVEPGGSVLIALGAVNRDPAVYPDPGRFEVARQTPHLAFGHGVHFCAGAALARVEAQEILTRLITMDPPLESFALHHERDTSPTFRRLRVLDLLAG